MIICYQKLEYCLTKAAPINEYKGYRVKPLTYSIPTTYAGGIIQYHYHSYNLCEKTEKGYSKKLVRTADNKPNYMTTSRTKQFLNN